MKRFTLLLIMFSGMAAAVAQNKPVSPLLTGHYLPGIINVRDFANPSPASGLIALDYNIFLSGNKFFGKDGEQVSKIKGPTGAPIDLNVDLNGYLNTPFPVWVSKFKILGANYITGQLLAIQL